VLQSNLTDFIDTDVQDPFAEPETKVTTPYFKQVVSKRACNQPDSLAIYVCFPFKIDKSEIMKAKFSKDGEGKGLILWVPCCPLPPMKDVIRNLTGFTSVDKTLIVHTFNNHPCVNKWDPVYFDLIVACNVMKEPHVQCIPNAEGHNSTCFVFLTIKKHIDDGIEMLIW
jgi:hypothetical protein